MCDESDGEIKYFIYNIVEDKRLFLDGKLGANRYKTTRNADVTDDDNNFSQVGQFV